MDKMGLFEKLFCMHDWTELESVIIHAKSQITGERLKKGKIIILKCKKCGKIKKVKLFADDLWD